LNRSGRDGLAQEARASCPLTIPRYVPGKGLSPVPNVLSATLDVPHKFCTARGEEDFINVPQRNRGGHFDLRDGPETLTLHREAAFGKTPLQQREAY